MEKKNKDLTFLTKEAKNYFSKALDGVSWDLPLEPDVIDKTDGKRVELVHPLSTFPKQIESFAKKIGVGEQSLFLGAFGYALAVFSGKEEASFVLEVDSCVLPLHFSFLEGEGVASYLQQADKTIQEGKAHAVLSVEELEKEFGMKADVVFGEEKASKLSASLVSNKDGYSLQIVYLDNVYSSALVASFADAYSCILDGFLKEKKLENVPLLSQKGEALLDSFNATEKKYLQDPVVVQFEKMAASYPNNTAVVCGEDHLTYQELDELSDRIGAYAQQKGLGAGDVVAILVPRGVAMASAAIGAQKAGCAYQPLDASYPTERLLFMLKDAGAKLLITTEELQKLVPDYQGNVLYLSEFKKLPKAKKLGIVPKPHDLFILLYTSGTTGTPKGVALEQGNLAAFSSWYRRYYGVDASCKVAAYASFGFDANMMDMYGALTNGAALHIIPEDMRLDFQTLDRYFCDSGITHAFMTTQVGRAFALETKSQTLRHLSVGGEKLTPIHLPESAKFHFHNGYGPTECTIFTTYFDVDRYYDRVPIGKVLDNFKSYVVDKKLHRLPFGALGELIVAGPQVSRGYLNRPEKTAEVYLQNPFCQKEGYEKVYKTGDVVRYYQDGVIDIIGRNDQQVKIRGFRVELPEVEEVIRRFPGILDATVADYDDPNGGKAIAAYVVSASKVDIKALNEFIAGQKPPYMVPSVTMQIERIPLNQNQKVNKRALPKPDAQPHQEAPVSAAPLNRLEEELSALVEEVLKVRITDVGAPLSSYGLTSISTIRLATLVYKKYGVNLDNGKLVQEGTLQMLENAILEKWMSPKEEKAETKESKSAKEAKRSCHLSFEQQGVYADCQQDPSSTRYNLPFCLLIPGKKETEEVKAALLKIIAAHPALRCHFVSDANNEVIMEEVEGYQPEILLKSMSKKELVAHKADFVQPFDLTQVPTRYEIVKCEQNLYLFFDLHHLLADGFSIDIFEEELCLALDGKEFDPEALDYFSYAEAEKILPEDEDFFAERMAISEEASQLIPDLYDKEAPHREVSVDYPIHLQELNALASKHGVTPAALGLAATQIGVSRYLCETTAAIATISSGRSNVAISDTIGMFVNTLALTSSLDLEQSVADYLHETGENFRATISHEHYPFARLASRFSFHPAISYAWQVGTLETHKTKDGELIAEALAPNTVKIPLSVFFEEEGEGAVIVIRYDESLYSKPYMEGFARSIAHVLDEFAFAKKLKDIGLTTEEDWKVLDSYNRPFDLNFNHADSVVSRFRYQVKSHPNKTAVVYQDKSYTYAELDEITDALAGKLYKKISAITGKKRLAECVVSILSGRNENVFLLPLSVLKTGCAYEPLDPSYPKERLNFMVNDAKASLLLCQDDLYDVIDEYKGEKLRFSELFAAKEEKLPDIDIKPEDLFIMLYTSGSTGTPKGVQIEHRNMVAYAHGADLEGFYTGDAVVAAYASFGFDVNMADTFCTLLSGGSVHLIPEKIRMDLPSLAKYFDDNGVTAILMTTQVGVQFVENYPKLKSLRFLTMGGEKLPALHPENLSYTIINGYGPTENCCGVSLFRIHHWEPNIPLGKPMRTIHGYVLDKSGHRLPAGAAGEYCLSGPQVSRGYLNRPDKTKEAYEQCPWNEFRLYHTGDVVRYRQNGDIEFVGRKDGQVKIRGFRIETKEVETVIREFPKVSDATVQAYDYETGGKYLAAFVVYDGKLDSQELSDFIKSRKPAYMVPTVIMQLDSIPLTVNQKVDKKALPRPQVQKASYVAPEGKVQEDLCRLFGEVLGVAKVGAEDDFFLIGGSSILAMKLVIAAGKAGYPIVYQNVFDTPTPKAMAEKLEGKKKEPEKKVSAPKTKQIESDSFYGPGTTEIGPDGYDYKPINELLRKNTIEAFKSGKKQPLGKVLLLGATGYLGSHVLHELLMTTDSRVICLVRPGKDASAKERLQKLYDFYFGAEGLDALAKRVEVIPGDITNPKTIDSINENGLTVINCAANVSHFGKGDSISKVDLGGVQNLIAWCSAHSSRLIQISTESVMGNAVDDCPPSHFRFNENVLYVGQMMEDNQYTYSKFLAERCVYEAILKDGFNGRVIRVGNLAPRVDGKFQINYSTNSFMRSLASYQLLGMVPLEPSQKLGIEPYNTMDGIVEFSPIEYVAKAVVLLSSAPKECVCYVASNNHLVRYGDVAMMLSSKETPMRPVEDEEFAAALQAALLDEKKADLVSELIAYASGNTESSVKMLGPDNVDNELTMQVLFRLGFRWPETGSEYVKAFVSKFKEVGFFH